MHSTKYLGGHSDLIAGVVTARTSQIYNQLLVTKRLQGAILVNDLTPSVTLNQGAILVNDLTPSVTLNQGAILENDLTPSVDLNQRVILVIYLTLSVDIIY